MLHEPKILRGRIWWHLIVGRDWRVSFFFTFLLCVYLVLFFKKLLHICRFPLCCDWQEKTNKQTNHKIPAKARNHQRINWLTSSNCSWMLNRRREIRRGDVRTSSTVNRHVSACFSSLAPLAAWIWMEEVLVRLISTDEPNQPRRRRLSESQLRRID